MADEWDDDYTASKPAATTRQNNNNNWGSKAQSKPAQDDDWEDEAPAKKSFGNQNQGRSGSYAKKDDDGWNDDPKPKSNGYSGGNAAKNDDDWGDEPATKSSGWNGGSTSNDNGWGNSNNDSSSRSYGNDGGNRGNRKPDWICNSCSKVVFGSKDSCFSCGEPKGDAKDAPPGASNRPKRASDWICSACGVKVFGSKTTCFKCQADKGDSKDAPADDGNASSSFRGGRASDWICSQCGVKVFGSKSSCFKCQADKGDSKDAPADDDKSSFNGDKGRGGGGGGNRDSNGERTGRPGDWSCSCGQSNFASRTECFKCKEPKPEGAGGDDDPKFNKDAVKEFYIPEDLKEDELFNTGISTGINFSKFKDIPVKVNDSVRNQAPKPCKSFKDSGLNDFLLENIEKCHYKDPTPIQQYAIPIIKGGRDLMACAQTGSGKTAAFLLPMIQTLMAENAPLNIARPYVVIMTPTRELCTQIYNEARKFAQGSIIKCCQIYGGTASRAQNSTLNNGCHILVATPGRLKDFCDKTFVTFENLRYFVLDEADRMLDMGFAPAVEEIMNNPTMVPAGKRQTLMFSATFPDSIQRLAGKYLHEYIFLAIGQVGGASKDVKQNVFEVSKFKKREKLMEILNSGDPRGTMVFVETKRTADFLASFLSESDHPTTSIHGDRKQSQREEALSDFKKGKMKVLIATSVAARGLDIPGVLHVVNYDIPKSVDDYVHRIGRTGRVGNVGKATSFFDAEQDSEIVNDLVNVLKEAGQEIPEFLSGGGSGGGGGGASSNTFGGTDFRKSAAAPAAHGGGADDEEW